MAAGVTTRGCGPALPEVSANLQVARRETTLTVTPLAQASLSRGIGAETVRHGPGVIPIIASLALFFAAEETAVNRGATLVIDRRVNACPA